MKTEYKRSAAEPVTEVTVIIDRVRFPIYKYDGTVIRHLTGQAIALPGFEEYNLAAVAPHGSKRKATKVQWSVYEVTTGLRVNTDYQRDSTFETTCAGALRRITHFGKPILDEAIEKHLNKRAELTARKAEAQS